ncbi:MAG TPA: ABC transporter substrate-binding protein [Anaerohalosphaeraceae bacterium]|jgi:peptide/nickel transport system substrate-binding protein|nr:ABC transporter substrate-binding protein [Anaerohalosphaeraceae bacterium]HRT50117.1 ABC transporter substrate-binding protein [Anaerohalosphaeraceae bacterium]HRT86051.1 ABC transporter substrate-binding protein [Anaerohalosphaeraceae bacterium]
MNKPSLPRIAAVLFVASLALAGCRKPPAGPEAADVTYDPTTDPLVNPPVLFEPPPDDPALINTDETLFVQLDGNPNTLNPLFASSQYEGIVQGVLYTGPFSFDKDMNWMVNTEVVESFEESEDHTTFILRIKPGLTWHDGHPFTADDIVFSWRQILDPAVPCGTQKPSVEPITECVALDPLTVKYVQPEPLATRLWNLHFPIIPKHIYEKDKQNNPDLRSGDYYVLQSRNPVGSGPYRLVEWKENDKIVVERWDGYKGRKPYFKRIIFRIIPDSNMSLLAFQKGQVHVIENLSAQQFARETNTRTFADVGYKAWGTQWLFGYIGWNMDGSNPFFTDVRVRRAMTHALNIPRILDKIYYNLASPCYGVYHPDSWMANPDIKLLPYDLEKAAALLDEAGWTVNPNDGWRYKNIDGAKVRLEFTLLTPQGSPTAPQIAAILQEDLKKLGVDMKTRTLEWSSFLKCVRQHEFQAQTAAWGTGTDPDTGWDLWRTEQYDIGRNYIGYSNPRVDELFAAGRREFDPEKRRLIYQEIHKILYDEQPYTWIYNRPILAAINKRIRGVQFSPRGIMSFDPGISNWWMPSAALLGQ